LARVLDPNLVNPWGISLSPTGPFWFADNGSGVSDLLDGRGQPVPLVVSLPSAGHSGGAPTGIVFNGSAGFLISENGVAAPSRFLFATEDGTIAAWSALVDPTHALMAVDDSSAGAVYKGLATATDLNGRTFLYAADFGRGTVDVFDQAFKSVTDPGSFRDPDLPAGFAPFNIQNLNNFLYVTYAQQDAARHDDVRGAGHGFIDVYDTDGHLLRRLTSQGALNSPWGLTLAPARFGPFGGALLVGNNGDGHINAYDPVSGTFLGPLTDDSGVPITVPGLWALTFGNGHAGGASDTLFFTAGVGYEAHGLFGAIQAPEKRGADTAGSGAFDPNAPGETGDYPLPPTTGPAFRASSDDRLVAVSDLLPLRDASLVLVPTLSRVSQPMTRVAEGDPGHPTGGDSFSASLFTTVGPSNAIVLRSGAGDSQPGNGAKNEPVTLTAFLDLNAVPNGAAQVLGTDGHGVTAASWPSVERNHGAQRLLAQAYVEEIVTVSSQEQGSGALSESEEADEPLPAAPPESHAVSLDDRSLDSQFVRILKGASWTKVMELFFAVSLSLLWTHWLKHERK
jgi:uncharacterized protein (TIGR03118 family)